MPILEVKNMMKTFGKTEVLKGIDFTLEKGQVLLGRSSGATCGYPGSAGHGLLAPSGGRSGGRSPMAF